MGNRSTRLFLLVVLLGAAFLTGTVNAQNHSYFTTNALANQACTDASDALWPPVGWTSFQTLVPPAFTHCPARPACYHKEADNVTNHFYHHLQDCGGACPTGWTEDPVTGQCIQDQDCPTGDKQRFHGDAGQPIPESVCSNGCWYEAQYDDVPVAFNMKGTAWSGNFASTGHACEVGGGPGGPPDNPPTNCITDSVGNTFCAGVGPGNAPPNCMEANGMQACIDAYDPMNCGYINGEKVCFDDYPDEGVCEFLPGGSYICFSGDQEPQSPPYPDTGTPGEPAEPDVQMVQDDEAGEGPGYTLDYFDSDTVEQSSGEGGSPGPTSDKTPPDDPTKIDGPVEVEINDAIQIDEQGTEAGDDTSLFDDIFNAIGLGEHIAGIDDIGAGTSTPMSDPPSTITDFVDTEIPTGASCADPVLVILGHTWTIPFVTKMGGFRDIVGWALYLWTALAIIHIALTLPKGGR